MKELRKARILIVEDEIIIAMDIQNTLKGLGYSDTIIAEDAMQAYSLVSAGSVDLVLMDIGLSGQIDGIEAAGELHKLAPSVPVMFLTSYSNVKIRERADKVFHYGYILKPFSPEILGNAVIKALKFND